MTKTHLLIALLLIIDTITVVYHLEEDRQKDLKYSQQKYDIQQQLEQTARELRSSRRLVDSINGIVTALHTYRKADSTLIVKLEAKLRNIPGRYDNVPSDSLGDIMNNRAENGRKTR